MTTDVDSIAHRVRSHLDALNQALNEARAAGLVVNTDVLETPMLASGYTRKFFQVELLQPLLAGAK